MNESSDFDFSYEASPLVTILSIAIFWALLITCCVLYQKNYKAIPEPHRKMEPGMVWLLLIPLFNLVWIFFVNLRLSDSFKSYFNSIGDTSVGDCARGIGLAAAICLASCIVPCLNLLAFPAAVVMLIIFLVKAGALRTKLESGGGAAVTPPAL